MRFAFGQVTEDIPTSGSATYVGQSYGRFGIASDNPDDFRSVTGDFEMTADFATLDVQGTSTVAGDTLGLSFDFAGDISGSEFAGRFETENGITGDIQGLFGGPEAAETAGVFKSPADANGLVFEGVFGAFRQPQ